MVNNQKQSEVVSEPQNENWYQRLKKRKGFSLLRAFVKSAAVGLLFAIVCFIYDVYSGNQHDRKLKNTVDKLEEIEQALSTRYLGIFPRYIPDINDLFKDIESSDTIVIFEDVLYYGVKSAPHYFRNLNVELLQHLMNSGSLTFAYYDYTKTGPAAFNLFHKMAIESKIDPKYHSIMDEKLREGNARMRERGKWTMAKTNALDSILCEKYFAMTRKDDVEKFEREVESYLSNELVSAGIEPNSPYSEVQVYKMCMEIDSIKRHYLGKKSIYDIRFCDYEHMFKKISETMVKYFTDSALPSKATLVPMNEYLTMSCWMVIKGYKKGVKAVLAFPSKYSSEEIGFYSQDEAFSRYITTMLEGVKNNIRNRQVAPIVVNEQSPQEE